jgi:glycogen(starch) synthase
MAAYAAARPVIVTDTGGLAETVEPGRSGLVVPPENAGALADALSAMVSDRQRMAGMGERARELADHVYAWDAVARRTLELYRSSGDSGRRNEKKGERGRL